MMIQLWDRFDQDVPGLRSLQHPLNQQQQQQQQQQHQQQHHNQDYQQKTLVDAEIVIFMDSNRKHIDQSKMGFSSNDKCKIIKCNTIKNIMTVFQSHQFTNTTLFLIHCGVNDVEHDSIDSIYQNLHQFITYLQKHINTVQKRSIHIAISEVIPRMDDLDANVQELNSVIRSNLNNHIIINHDNLRKKACYSDKKHINQRKIPLLVGNIKNNIRRALNITKAVHSQSSGFQKSTIRSQNKSTNQLHLQNQSSYTSNASIPNLSSVNAWPSIRSKTTTTTSSTQSSSNQLSNNYIYPSPSSTTLPYPHSVNRHHPLTASNVSFPQPTLPIVQPRPTLPISSRPESAHPTHQNNSPMKLIQDMHSLMSTFLQKLSPPPNL